MEENFREMKRIRVENYGGKNLHRYRSQEMLTRDR